MDKYAFAWAINEKMQIRIKKFENGVACKCNQSTKQVYTLIISNIPHKAYKDIYIYIYISISVYC